MDVLSSLLIASVTMAPVARFPFWQPLQPPRRFQVMAHRGMMRQAPENTRAAIERAVEDGFEWVEVDVRLTRDGQHVLLHSDRLEGVTDGRGRVQDHSLAQLQSLDAGSWFAPRFGGERLLGLKECLELARRRINLYLDCKRVDPARLAGEILAAEMQTQVVVYDDPETLSLVQRASNGRVAVMTKWRPGDGLEGGAGRVRPEAVEIDAPDVGPEICRAFHDRGLWVQAKVLGEWDRPAMWERVIEAGADWLQTDLPEDLVAEFTWKRRAARPVRIAAHRGAGRYAPENTLPAFAKAVELGIDYLECDVRASRDGRFHLLHDRTLDRTTNGRGPLAEATAAQLARLDAGSWFGRLFAPARIPLFEDLLGWLPDGVRLYVDAKDIPPEALAARLRRHDALERSVVYQGADYLERLRAVEPRARAMPPLGDPAQLAALAARLQPFAVDARWDILSAELIRRCHERDILVFSDALGRHETIADYRQAIEWGIDTIQTDHPLRVMRAVELAEGAAARDGRQARRADALTRSEEAWR